MDTAAAAVFGDLEGDRARVRKINARKEESEKKKIWSGKSGKSEREWRGAERSTNLKERISSGRVIKSENQ